MEHTIGIDFGTTKTLVSYYDSKNKTPCYVRLGGSIDKMPTTIYVDEDGVWQFGDEADDYRSQSPMRYKRDFKLDLGKNAPVLGAKVNGRIRQYTAKDLTAKFLKHIKDQCEEMVFHETVTSCTVTHPVAFSIAQREELKAAAQEAGFEHVRLLPEPEAAGYAYYASGADKHLSKLMVVDWGGGTVDFAMVQFEGNEVYLISNSYGGEVNVGGRKFDELLFDHLSNKIRKNDGACLDGSDLKLQKDVCRYKEKLSMVTAVKQVVLVGSNSQIYRTEVGRDEFNTIITPVVDRVVNQLKRLLDKCAEKPEALLLIGGSSAVPFVRERLEEETGLKCVNWDKRNEAVAIGAAWYGSTFMDSANRSSVANQTRKAPDSVDKGASRAGLTSTTVQQKCWKTGGELESYIRERKNEHDNFWYFILSMIVTRWQLNPVNISVRDFNEEIDKIGETDDSKVRSLRIRQGLKAIDLGNFDKLVQNIADIVGDQLKKSLNIDDAYVELYPGLKAIAVRGKMPDFDIQALKNAVSMQLNQLQGTYNGIRKKYAMLKEGYSRYDAIVAGDSFLKIVEGRKWKHLSNQDFVQTYVNALEEFISECNAFTDLGKDLLSKTVMQMQDLYGRVFEREEAYLRALNAVGVDLTEVEKRIDENEKATYQDPDFVTFIALAVQNLKEEAHISENRIRKLVEKLRRFGAPLSADGDLTEAAQQALVPVDKEAEDTATKFWEIVGKCKDCINFYIDEDIPQDKLANALRNYATGAKFEDVLCLYDSTIWGSGAEGFVITVDGLCWKNDDTPYFCSWEDMRTVFVNHETSNEISIIGIGLKVPDGEQERFETMFRNLRDLLS